MNLPDNHSDPHSCLIDLECSTCGLHYAADKVQTFCTVCQSPLLARYNVEQAARILNPAALRSRPQGMWRWFELLPLRAPQAAVTLGEGDTPLLPLPNLGAHLGFTRLFVKDESANPTGTFKARGLATAVSKAREFGLQKVIIPTAGNAGGAMAAYAARAGMQALVVMPADTPPANIIECRMAGAEVVQVDGLISDAARLVRERTAAEGWFDLSTFKEPYRLEGKKIMGYELAEAFDWSLPDVIVYPTGGGTGLVGMWKAFAELEALGWLKSTRKPRLVSVQAAGCAPVVKAFHAGASSCEFWPEAATLATGLRVPKSFADRLILADLRLSEGTAVAVSDQEILDAQRLFGKREGLFTAPEGAATLAALLKLIDSRWIHADERVVLFNTGTGLKYLDLHHNK